MRTVDVTVSLADDGTLTLAGLTLDGIAAVTDALTAYTDAASPAIGDIDPGTAAIAGAVASGLLTVRLRALFPSSFATAGAADA